MAKQYITEGLRLALVKQISIEKYNSAFYSFIASFLKNKGLDGLAKHFSSQIDEEFEHHKMILSFLTDMNAPVDILAVDAVQVDTLDIIKIAEAYLAREIATTKELEAIKELCYTDDEGVAEEFLRDMIKIQRTELEEAYTFLDNAELTGSDWWKVKVWSDSL